MRSTSIVPPKPRWDRLDVRVKTGSAHSQNSTVTRHVLWCTSLGHVCMAEFLYTSSDAHTLVLASWRCFMSRNRHPHPGDPTKVDKASACVQVAFYWPHSSHLFSQSHLDTCTAASKLLLMALHLLGPVMPGLHYIPSRCTVISPPDVSKRQLKVCRLLCLMQAGFLVWWGLDAWTHSVL